MPSSAWRSTLFPYTTLFRSDRKSTRLNSSHDQISYAVFCLKKKKEELLGTIGSFTYMPSIQLSEMKYLAMSETADREGTTMSCPGCIGMSRAMDLASSFDE